MKPQHCKTSKLCHAHSRDSTVTCIAFSSDSSLLAAGTASADRVTIWGVENSIRREVLSGHGRWLTGVAFPPSGPNTDLVIRPGKARSWCAGQARPAWKDQSFGH
ncbi:MAG: hypothetical protein ACODAD_09405 [Planctomycetota bacterium]